MSRYTIKIQEEPVLGYGFSLLLLLHYLEQDIERNLLTYNFCPDGQWGRPE